MKKILSVLMALVLVSLMLPAAAEDAGEDFKGVTLNVFNWGSYIDEEETVLRNFEITRTTIPTRRCIPSSSAATTPGISWCPATI